jgi:hypothetical protein
VKTALVIALALIACAHANADPVPPSTTPTSAAVEPGSAHRVLIDATACWFGDTWSEAIGDRNASPRSRCASALSRAYERPLDTARVERLQDAEPVEVTELSQRMRAMAASDPIDSDHADSIAVLLRATGAAVKEQVRARRTQVRVQTKVEDARAGANDLSSSSALGALFKLDAGALTPEARLVAVMLAAERIRLADDLPTHSKVLVVQGPVELLFDLHPPPMPADPADHVGSGTWLAYLEDIATAAHNPVPTFVGSPADRERFAWAGMLEGVATKLRARKDAVPRQSELTLAAAGMSERLEAECKRDQPR